MHIEPMELHVIHEHLATGTRRTIRLDQVRDPDRRSVTIFFDMAGEHSAPPPVVLDGFVMGVIFYAMSLGQPIRVRGAMSRAALRNLSEFQDAWTLWKGDRYSKVPVIPDVTLESANFDRNDQAIAAFSGGVDSVFTLLRHATPELDAAAFPLRKSVLLVHGFDIRLDRPDQLEALKERTAPLLAELALGVKTISTNLKEAHLQDWEDSFLAQLACCLHNYSHEFEYALVGSSEPYDALVLPWGSNPATDHLLSGAALRVVHDGAGYSRTQKVEKIAKHPIAAATVKVCWEGSESSTNCGVCEKCVRTRLNFLAVGVADPPCFDSPLRVRQQIRGLVLRNDAVVAELESIVTYANRAGTRAEWLHELEERLQRPRAAPRGKFYEQLRAALQMVRERKWRRFARAVVRRGSRALRRS